MTTIENLALMSAEERAAWSESVEGYGLIEKSLRHRITQLENCQRIALEYLRLGHFEFAMKILESA